jgi:hypothetical protein
MTDLTKKEIMAELKKLGIDHASELDLYYNDYREYSVKCSPTYFARTLRKIIRQLLLQRKVNGINFHKEKYPGKLRHKS